MIRIALAREKKPLMVTAPRRHHKDSPSNVSAKLIHHTRWSSLS